MGNNSQQIAIENFIGGKGGNKRSSLVRICKESPDKVIVVLIDKTPLPQS